MKKGILLIVGLILLVAGIADVFIPDPVVFLDEIGFICGGVAAMLAAVTGILKRE